MTPHEICDKEFSRQIRGYSIGEVDDFLDEIVTQFETIYRENATLKAKISTFEDRLVQYEKIEKTLQETMVLAQGAAQAARDQAAKESEAIISEAKDIANKIGLKSQKEHAEILKELQRSKMEFENYRSRILSFMESQMMSFDMMTKELGAGKPGSLNMTLPSQPTLYEFAEDTPLG